METTFHMSIKHKREDKRESDIWLEVQLQQIRGSFLINVYFHILNDLTMNSNNTPVAIHCPSTLLQSMSLISFYISFSLSVCEEPNKQSIKTQSRQQATTVLHIIHMAENFLQHWQCLWNILFSKVIVFLDLTWCISHILLSCRKQSQR